MFNLSHVVNYTIMPDYINGIHAKYKNDRMSEVLMKRKCLHILSFLDLA